jgi:ABC-2 type transport system ATP-binding protein
MTVPSGAIHVQAVQKVYHVPERAAGLRASLQSLIRPQWREVRAVDTLSFDVAPGEIVGFLGPNGAGKTTTLKMLAGLLYPTAGVLSVLGYQPWQREAPFLRQIALVMGNRNQLAWDLPATDSFELHRTIYRIPQSIYQQTLHELVDLLELGPLLRKPIRTLSLGERMRCELVAALLHHPRVLFLDEPTLGLDVTLQRRIRAFVSAYNQRFDATILLTSHYMADVTALCKRVVVIRRGQLLFDGDLSTLIERYAPHKTIVVTLATDMVDLTSYGAVMSREDGRVTLRVPKEDTAQVTGRLLADLPVTDLVVEDPPIDDVIDHVFSGVMV